MKTSKIFAIVVVALMIAVAVPVISAEMTGNNSVPQDLTSNTEAEVSHKNIQTNIFTSDPIELLSSSLDKYTTKISGSASLSDLVSISSPDAMVVIDETWTADKNIEVVESSIDTLVKRGNPVVIVGDSPDLLMKSGQDVGFTSFSVGAQVYAMLHDPDTGSVICISVLGDDTKSTSDLLGKAYQMISEALDDDSGAPVGNLGAAYRSYFDSDMSKGNMASKTTYHKILGDNDPDYDYYIAHYRFSATPTSGHSKSAMWIDDHVGSDGFGYSTGQMLYSYKPTTTAGSTTIGIYLGADLSKSDRFGASVGVGASWSQTLHDVTVQDNSLPGSEYFNLKYAINECKDSGYNTLTIEPGMIISAPVRPDGSSSCNVQDRYRAEFCDIVLKNLWHNNFKTETVFQVVSFAG